LIKIITINDLIQLIQSHGLKNFFLGLIARLRQDFSRWSEFQKSPRHVTHYPHGVLELMPISDNEYYSFKFVNGHPNNPHQKNLSVVGLGLLADVASGYPLMICEMTLLTALRTAATSALASSYLAQEKPQAMAIIGTGAQSEFQILAHHYLLNISRVHYYDIDSEAMAKFARNLAKYGLELIAAADSYHAIKNADIITTATAAKINAHILENSWIRPGMHINAIGGDCPGKTELDPNILNQAKIVVENLEQTQREGEIQHLKAGKIYAELWEIVCGNKPGRQNPDEIFIFDSVGFAMEDYTILRYIYELSRENNFGQTFDLIPSLTNPKDLFSLLTSDNAYSD
jgi:ornithine cyclodeaminase